MDIKSKLFLVASDLSAQRKAAIDTIKKQIPSHLLQPGMLTNIFASQAVLKNLQEDILTFSLAGEKVIFFKDAQDLGDDINDYLAENIVAACAQSYIVFEFDEALSRLSTRVKKDKLIAVLLAQAQVIKLSEAKPDVSWDDLTQAMRRNDVNSTLFSLEKILEQERIEKIAPSLIGMLTARSSYLNDLDKKKKSLQYIFDADRAIKERGQDTRTVLEALLVKLLTL